MNKKLLLSLLIISLFFVVGCTKNKENNLKKENTTIQSNSNSVVVFFSATGNTKTIAQKIAKLSNSDNIEIIPKEKYTSKDLDYNSDCRANKEQNNSNSRPEIENTMDISKYDTIYLGYPIWWGTNPKIILTFLDTYDLTEKVIIPFCTSGSTDITSSVNDLRKYNSDLIIKDGKRFSLSDSDEVIKEFIKDNKNVEESKTIKAIIDEKEYTINLEDNETAKSLVNLLPQEFIMSELNGNEKYVNLDNELPTNETNIKRINKGDVMLYGNNCLVIFYKSFDTTFSYTKIGHIDNLDDLGTGSIEVKIEK